MRIPPNPQKLVSSDISISNSCYGWNVDDTDIDISIGKNFVFIKVEKKDNLGFSKEFLYENDDFYTQIENWLIETELTDLFPKNDNLMDFIKTEHQTFLVPLSTDV